MLEKWFLATNFFLKNAISPFHNIGNLRLCKLNHRDHDPSILRNFEKVFRKILGDYKNRSERTVTDLVWISGRCYQLGGRWSKVILLSSAWGDRVGHMTNLWWWNHVIKHGKGSWLGGTDRSPGRKCRIRLQNQQRSNQTEEQYSRIETL